MRAGFWLAVVLLALAAGCGGSATKGSQPAATHTATTGASAPSFTTRNCAKLARLGETFANALQASTTGSATLADEAAAFGAMADAAPGEIRAEFHTLADAFAGYADAMKSAGLTLGQTPTPTQIARLAEAAKTFGNANVKAAEEKISAWAAANCGFRTSTGG